jgi:hypothetical protein
MSIMDDFVWPTSWSNTSDTYQNFLARYNSSNTSTDFLSFCYTPKTFSDLGEFWEFYKAIASEKFLTTFLEILVAFGSAFINTLVIICVILSSHTNTCFDQILVGYCLVNGITGLIYPKFLHFFKIIILYLTV